MTKDDFETASMPLDQHMRMTHYFWNYLYYMVGLKEKSQEEMNGLEIEIKRKIGEGDLSWFPLHRTKLLQTAKQEQEELEVKIKRIIQKVNLCLAKNN